MTPEQRETHAAVLRDLVQDAATEARPEMKLIGEFDWSGIGLPERFRAEEQE